MMKLRSSPEQVEGKYLVTAVWHKYINLIVDARKLPGSDISLPHYKPQLAYALLITALEDLERTREGWFQEKLGGADISQLRDEIEVTENRERAAMLAEWERIKVSLMGLEKSRSPAGALPSIHRANLKRGLVMDDSLESAIFEPKRKEKEAKDAREANEVLRKTHRSRRAGKRARGEGEGDGEGDLVGDDGDDTVAQLAAALKRAEIAEKELERCCELLLNRTRECAEWRDVIGMTLQEKKAQNAAKAESD